MQAFRSLMCQGCIVRPDAFGHRRLLDGKIIEFVDHCNINACRTGLAMTAVSALPKIGMQWCGCYDRRIVFLIICGMLIGNRLVNLFCGIISAKDGSDGRAGQGVMDQLHRCEGNTERGTGRIKECSTEKALV